MENFIFKLKDLFFSIGVFFLLIIPLLSGEPTIPTYIDNYTKSVYTFPATVQIQLTNYLLIVNTLESLAENSRIDSSLNNLILNSESESVRHHAKIVKMALANDHSEIFNFKDQTHKLKDSKENVEHSLLIFLEYINQNMFNNK